MCALELPGHGESQGFDPGTYTLEGLREVVKTWVDVAELRGAACVGHSLGGHLWLELGTEALDRQAGVFVFATPVLRSVASFPEAFLPHPAVALAGQRELDGSELARFAAAVTGIDDADDPRFAATVEAMRVTDGRFREGVFGSLPGQLIDEVAAFERSRRPAAVVHGNGDPMTRLEYLEGLPRERLWRGGVQIVAGGHSPHAMEPAAFESLLSAFLADVLGAPPG